MQVDTRPSLLYATLFSAVGDKAGIFLDVLVGIAIFFGVIELIALFIGMRLTRSITKSVVRTLRCDPAREPRRLGLSHQGPHPATRWRRWSSPSTP